MATKKFAIEAVFRGIDKISGPLDRMAASVQRSTDRMERKLGAVRNVVDGIGSGARRGAAVVAAGIGTAAAGLTKITRVGGDFEQTMTRAGAKFGGIEAGTQAFNDLEDAALRVSGATEFTGTQSAEALEFMATAGESAAVAMGSLSEFADFATATTTDLSRAADIASDSIAALGLDLDASGRKLRDPIAKIEAYAKTTGFLATTALGANLTLEDVFETTKKAGSAARGAGLSVEEFGAAVQAVSGVIKGSEAGTGLRIIFKSILNDAGKAGEAMRQLKVSPIDTKTGKIRPILAILRDVDQALKGMTEGKRARAMSALFGEAEPTARALLSDLDDFERRVGEITRVAPTKVAEMASFMRGTTNASLASVGSTIETIVIRMFQELRGEIKGVADESVAWLRANKDLFPAAAREGLRLLKLTVETLATHGKGLMRLMFAFIAFSKALALISGGLSLLSTILSIFATVSGGAAMGTAAVGIGALALAVASTVLPLLALVVLLGIVVFAWDETQEVMMDFYGWVESTFTPMLDTLGEIWDALIDGIQSGDPVWLAVAAAIAVILGPIGILALAAGVLMDNWAGVSAFFKNLWDGIVLMFTDSIRELTDQFGGMMDTLHDVTGLDMFKRDFAASVDVDQGAFAAPDLAEAERSVVNTTSQSISRSVEETLQTSRVAITLNDPGGAVQTVTQENALRNLLTLQPSGAF